MNHKHKVRYDQRKGPDRETINVVKKIKEGYLHEPFSSG
jgi:hypothetical protein